MLRKATELLTKASREAAKTSTEYAELYFPGVSNKFSGALPKRAKTLHKKALMAITEDGFSFFGSKKKIHSERMAARVRVRDAPRREKVAREGLGKQTRDRVRVVTDVLLMRDACE